MTDTQEQAPPDGAEPYKPDLFNDYPALAPYVGEIAATRVRTTDTRDIAEMYPSIWAAANGVPAMEGGNDELVGVLAAMLDQVKILVCLPVPDFFEPGEYYIENRPYAAPEQLRLFHCQLVTRHPTAGDEIALGFGRQGVLDGHSGGWHLTALARDEWQRGWVKKA